MKYFDKYNPATGDFLWKVPIIDKKGVEEGIRKIKEVQPKWAALPVQERAKAIRRMRKNFVKRMDEFIDVIMQETGKNEMDAIIEIFVTCVHFKYLSSKGKKLLQDERRRIGIIITKKAYVSYLPYGVVGIISPWNYPLVLTAISLGHALLAGNGVIMKPSELTSKTSELLREVAIESGIDENLFIIASGDASTGNAIVESSGTNLISFTGSSEIGQIIAEKCSKILKPCILELGGKDPMIVLRDANLERAANGAVWGSLLNTGQQCISIERIYIEEPVYDKFIELVAEKMKTLRLGLKEDIGCLVCENQIEIIEDHIRDAVSKGAKVLTGGKRTKKGSMFFEPTLIVNVNHDMKIMNEETFGPAVAVMKVRDLDEAVQLSNSSIYGLAGSIWSRNKICSKRIARRLDAGTVCLNDIIVHYMISSLPFGGFKYSGLGKLHGPEGVRAFVRHQAVVSDRLGLKKELWWYPYSPRIKKLFKNVIKLLYR